ncbi:MAG TPA: polysaccharide biosynthesis/export family protein [Chlamydiales bacterium]|nr:polysaccharide biosynthesis/export family protein [Chlamydiales bacterium]
MISRFALFLYLFLSGCCGPYMGKNLYGPDEFVMDSYRIREGKWAILEMEGQDCLELDDSFLEEYQDQIHEDDVLQISIYQPKRKDITDAVDYIGARIGYRVIEGKVTLPDLLPIPVEGLTLEEARQAIQCRYQEQIRDTEVFVTYKERIAKKVELAGLVHISSLPVDGKIRLFEVLAKAQIPSDANLFMSYLIRDNKVVPVDMNRLMKQGDMGQNIVMCGGDKIYIAEPTAASLMVMGEVGRERVIALPSGYMPLRKALAEAGGIPYTGDKSYIQVIRGNIIRPKIYTLSWEHVIHLPNESLLLMPGDIVYVAAKPITEWNRFVSQLLPSFSGLQTVSQVMVP